MNDAGRDLGAEIEKTMRDLEGLGRAWAAHGLRVGRAALETSATTLKTTATLLGRIAAQFEEAQADAGAADSKEPAPAHSM